MKKQTGLGTLDASIPLLIFGGPYGNLQATQAILNKARTLNIPPSHIICTGDIPAYCANPLETSDLIRQSKIHTIQGNCEQSLMNEDDDCNCGFEEDSSCSILSKKWFSFCEEQINEETKKWYRTLPEQLNFIYGSKKWSVIHGGSNLINEFIFLSDDTNKKYSQIEDLNADAIISGHSGIPFTQIIKNKCWHNAGGIGMPANDGTSRVWYSIIKATDTGFSLKHHALEYNFKEAQENMEAAGLNYAYKDCLESGLWPSLDILPSAEQEQTGQTLQEDEIIWGI